MTSRSWIALAFAIASLAGSTLATAASPDGGCVVDYSSPDAALAALRAKPRTQIREENGWVVAEEPADHVFWSITSEAHPAHPTIVKRCLVEREKKVMMEMSVSCGAEKWICDRVVEQFRQINASLPGKVQQ